MGVNVSFKGNVYDENNIAIDCKYQVHYVRQNIWNNVRDTTSQYYSANAGDADSLTQDGSIKANDVILVAFWQGDGLGGPTPNNRDNLFDRFGVYAIVYDGVTADYVINVQLKPKFIPNINWTLTSAARINNNVHAYDYSNDESSWVYAGKTLYHRHSYYSHVVFPKVGLLTTTYDWSDTNAAVTGFETSPDHIFTVIGDYSVHLKVINAWSLENNDIKPIRLKYNIPIGGLSFNPDGTNILVHTTENSTYTASITDVDNRITSIEHRWLIQNRDTNATISDELIASNLALNYQYTKTILALQNHYGKQVITWNDGWVDQVVTYTKQLPITNWLPLVNFTNLFLNDTKIRFTPNCSDIDGSIVQYTWNLYALVPFQAGQYTLAKTDINTTGADVEVIFDAAGHYKMSLTVQDDYGDSATYSKEFDITLSGSCSTVAMIEEDVFFIIPDEIDY